MAISRILIFLGWHLYSDIGLPTSHIPPPDAHHNTDTHHYTIVRLSLLCQDGLHIPEITILFFLTTVGIWSGIAKFWMAVIWWSTLAVMNIILANYVYLSVLFTLLIKLCYKLKLLSKYEHYLGTDHYFFLHMRNWGKKTLCKARHKKENMWKKIKK